MVLEVKFALSENVVLGVFVNECPFCDGIYVLISSSCIERRRV